MFLAIDCWNDFVCVWKKADIENIEKSITLHTEIINNIDILEKL